MPRGDALGAVIAVPELEWAAQAIPHYDYLLDAPEPGAVLAGGHCIPVRLPQASRLVWHKLYSSLQRRGFPEKAVKDRQQALILAAILADLEPQTLQAGFRQMPEGMLREVAPLASEIAAAPGAPGSLRTVLRACIA